MDLSPALRDRLRRARWHATAYIQPHSYLVEREDPTLYQEMRALIHQHGYDAPFAGLTYRYVDVDGYKYWSIPPVLNREPLPLEDPPHG